MGHQCLDIWVAKRVIKNRPSMSVLVSSLLFLAPTASLSQSSERKCLAEALYFEARDQGWRGMLAVGIVIQNRVRDPRYPETVCAVVRQGEYRDGNPVRHKCQFSYYCDGKPERPVEKEAWSVARDLSRLLLTTQLEIVGLERVTHYHADWVDPPWSKVLEPQAKIGRHIFYKAEKK
jgi:spore germination cell wall hydrolase CwlJ-like protein